jgi:hypothetical protein
MYLQLVAEMGAQILLVPSAFTVPTGQAHWHTLLRGANETHPILNYLLIHSKNLLETSLSQPVQPQPAPLRTSVTSLQQLSMDDTMKNGSPMDIRWL